MATTSDDTRMIFEESKELENVAPKRSLQEIGSSFVEKTVRLKSYVTGHENIFLRSFMIFIYGLLLICACALIATILFYAIGFPILALTYSHKYKNDITCDKSVGKIHLYNWLMVYGIVQLSYVAYGIVRGSECIHFDDTTHAFIDWCVVCFTHAWAIIGGVLLWGKCDNDSGLYSINILMNIVLIVTYFFSVGYVRFV